MPEAYLKNRVEFMGIDLISQLGTYIPKKHTECLVTVVLHKIETDFGTIQNLNIIDMCTGSGNIAIAVAMNVPEARVYGTDISKNAIKTANKNAKRYHLNKRVRFLKGDLFDPLKNMHLEGKIDVIICNPPYIPTKKIKNLSKSIVDYEPWAALDGGAFGLRYYMRVVSDSVKFLKPGGFLAFEVGNGQEQMVARFIARKECFSPADIIQCPGFSEKFVLDSRL